LVISENVPAGIRGITHPVEKQDGIKKELFGRRPLHRRLYVEKNTKGKGFGDRQIRSTRKNA